MDLTQTITRTILAIGIVLALAIVSLSSGTTSTPRLATDVSWPNCNAFVEPRNSQWGIVGVTGGLNFRQNPCMTDETKWFNHYALYVNTGYPGWAIAHRFNSFPRTCQLQDEFCVAYDYGYAAGIYAVKYANSKAVHSTLWWLDVETTNSWSTDPNVNRASLLGTFDAVRQLTFSSKVGYYSYPSQWDRITGDWRNRQPNWVATGTFSPVAAIAACQGHSFTGGNTWLTQYTQGLDNNYICNDNFTNTLDKLQ